MIHDRTDLFLKNEDRLMRRTLAYAKRFGFTRYTSTLEEAWRISISGITASIVAGAKQFSAIPELAPEALGEIDPLTEFGVQEARRHRTRGITIDMFLGLLKYYRQSYDDLIHEEMPSGADTEVFSKFVNRCFDRIELAFCREWSNTGHDEQLAELQQTARWMTNEKNIYLTVVESLSDPVIVLDTENRIVNINFAASLIADPEHVPGGPYYHSEPARLGPADIGKRKFDSACIGQKLTTVFPWMEETLKCLARDPGTPCEVRYPENDSGMTFEVKRSLLLDVSEKLSGSIIIFRDITSRKQSEAALRQTVDELSRALTEVKRLSGLLPICADCKKVRDDKGYWRQVEQYVAEHSEAVFSHGICPDCVRKHYPDYDGDT